MNAKTCEKHGVSPGGSIRTASVVTAAPTIPVGLVRALPEIARRLGIELEPLLHEARVHGGVFVDHGQRIAYPELERLFHACERHSDCDHVGLLLGQRTRLRDLGAAASVALREPTAGSGLRSFVAHCNLHDTPATARLDVQDNRARFTWMLGEHSLVDSRHFEFMGTAIGFNVLQDLFGTHWEPVAVRFASRNPVDPAAFHSLFRAPLVFDAGVGEIEFESSWLERPLPQVEPGMLAAMAAELQQLRAEALADLPTTLRRVLRKRLLASDFSMDDVAAQLSMHRRTLDRRLQRNGTTYGELLESVRDEIARQLLRETQFSVQRVADSVRFSSAANFATAFRRRAGMTPTEFRRRAS